MNFASKIGRFFFVVVIVSFLFSPLVCIQVSHAQSDDGSLGNQSNLFLPLVTGNGLAGQTNEQENPPTIGQTQADNGPIHDDEYWATLTENEPRWEPTGQVRAALGTNVGGEWGPVIPWPHTPVAMAAISVNPPR